MCFVYRNPERRRCERALLQPCAEGPGAALCSIKDHSSIRARASPPAQPRPRDSSIPARGRGAGSAAQVFAGTGGSTARGPLRTAEPRVPRIAVLPSGETGAAGPEC